MDPVELFDLFICLPDGGQTGGLCGHHIHADTEVGAQFGNARTYKFHYFIFYITFSKNSANDSQCHILRANPFCRLTGQIDGNHTRHIDVIGLTEQLFYQLRSAFPHSHGSKGSVTGMGIGTKDHFSTLCQHFTGKLMNDCLMRRYINATVFLCTGQAKHVVILIDRSAYCTKTVMTVCQHIGNRKFFKA